MLNYTQSLCICTKMYYFLEYECMYMYPIHTLSGVHLEKQNC